MAITRREVDGATVVEMDDGKANALTIPALTDLLAVLDDARSAPAPVVITGRPGMLCAGYDLETIRSGEDQANALLQAGRSFYRGVLESPAPVIVASPGHAMAAGALLLLVADLRFAQAGAFRIGLNEVRIGLALPEFGVTVASQRLAPPFVTRAVALGEVVGPEEARAFGFVDHVVDEPVLDAAIAAAVALREVPAEALATTKARRNAALLAALAAL